MTESTYTPKTKTLIQCLGLRKYLWMKDLDTGFQALVKSLASAQELAEKNGLSNFFCYEMTEFEGLNEGFEPTVDQISEMRKVWAREAPVRHWIIL